MGSQCTWKQQQLRGNSALLKSFRSETLLPDLVLQSWFVRPTLLVFHCRISDVTSPGSKTWMLNLSNEYIFVNSYIDMIILAITIKKTSFLTHHRYEYYTVTYALLVLIIQSLSHNLTVMQTPLTNICTKKHLRS